MKKPILIYGIYSCLALLLTIPLVVSSSMFFPYITGKNFLFRGVVVVLTVLWVTLMIQDKSYRPQFSWIAGGVIFWVVWMFIANIFGVSPSRSLWGNFERMEGWITLLYLLLLFLSLVSVLKTKEEWQKLFNASLLVSIIPAIHAFVEHLNGVGRADAAFGNSTYLGGYALIHAFLSLLMLWWWKQRHPKSIPSKSWQVWGYSLLAVAHIITIYVTGTRGAFLGLIGGVSLMSLLGFFMLQSNPRLRKLSLVFLILLTIGTGSFFAFKNTSFVQDNNFLSRIANISLTEGTAKARIVLWGLALDSAQERPLTGWGQENFIYAFSKNYDPRMYDQEPWFDRTHNVILDWLISGGIIGLLAYLFLFFGTLWVLWKNTFSIPEKLIFTGLFIAYFVHNFFVFDNIVSYILFVLLLGYMHMSIQKKGEHHGPLIENQGYRSVTLGLIWIIGGVILAIGVFSGVGRAQALISGLSMFAQGSYDEGLSSIEKAYTGIGVGFKEEVSSQMTQLAFASLNTPQVSQEIKQKFVERAMYMLIQNSVHEPDLPRSYIFLGALSSTIGNQELALNSLKSAVDISPQKQSILYQFGDILIKEGNLDEALSVFKKAYDVEPSNKEALRRYSAVLIKMGNIKKAESLLELYPEEVAHPTIIQAYYEAGELDVVIELMKELIRKEPTRVDYYISLAAAYNEKGNKPLAIKTLEDAQKIDPSRANEFNALIRELK